MRLILADDHPLIRSGIEAALRGSEFQIVGTASCGSEVFRLIRDLDPDILLLDVRMPDESGLQVLRRLREIGDQRRVVLLTGTITTREAVEAIDLRVNGLLLKENSSDSLLRCLEAVGQGKNWIDQEVLQEALHQKLHEPESLGWSRLTPREQAVSHLVAAGRPNKIIGFELGITEGTVKVYLTRIYEKLHVANRTELAMLVSQIERGCGERGDYVGHAAVGRTRELHQESRRR